MFEGRRLAEGLAEMPPGPELGMVLAGVDREKLSGFDRVVLMKAHHRLVAHYQSELYADMVAVTDAEQEARSPDLDMGEILDVAAGEIRAALTWTRRAAEYQLVFASMLVEDHPQVWKALPAGRIDVPKARVICNQTIHLDPELREQGRRYGPGTGVGSYHRPATSPDQPVGHHRRPVPNATSTTTTPGQKADPPPTPISPPSADTTTSSDTKAGKSNKSDPAPTR